jgi:ABC-type proline/glycine betaine transport system permease subunit
LTLTQTSGREAPVRGKIILHNIWDRIERMFAWLKKFKEWFVPPSQVKRDGVYYKARMSVAAFYFLLPLITSIIVFIWFHPCEQSKFFHIWHFLFCFLAGCWGLAMRAFQLRNYPASTVEYFTIFPLVILMNASAVFTILTLLIKYIQDQDGLGLLFYTAAAPLCMVMGYYCHPGQWILAYLIARGGKQIGP